MSSAEPVGIDEDPVLIERLAAALDEVEAGRTPDPQLLCRDRPDLEGALREALAEAAILPELHRAAAGFDPLVGSVLGGRYCLQGRIGSGGMGVVYRALDRELQREVAVKMLRPESVAGEEMGARLDREAEVLAALRHPAIVTVHDRGRTEDGRTWLVMSLLEGPSAADLVDGREAAHAAGRERDDSQWLSARLAPEARLEDSAVRQVTRWAAELARGLEVAHHAGVVHRDVKPSNIIVQRSGQPVLIDFGLVSLLRERTLRLDDAALGTPAYMAPEQLDPRREATPAVDVYSLTATLYHLLTFSRPYSGTPSQVLAALQRNDPVPANRLRPGLPTDLQAVIDKGMARDPRARYPSARELADDLEAWLDFRPVTARPVTRIERAWRKVYRAPAFRPVAAICLTSLLAFGGLQVRALRDAARSRAESEVWAGIGPSLLNAPAHLRVPVDPDARVVIRGKLDRLVELSERPGIALVLRAEWLADRGQSSKAAADFDVLAAAHDSPVCRQAASELHALGGRGAGDVVESAALPEPRTDLGRFVVAFRLLRQTPPAVGRALDVLEACRGTAPGLPELRLLAGLQRAASLASRAERLEAFREAHDAAVRLETRRGRASATTSQCRAVALLGQSRWREARAALAVGVELAPKDFALHVGLGSAARQCKDADAAERSLRIAIALQPASVRAHELLARLAIDREAFDTADEWIDRAPFGGRPADDRRRAELRGLVLLQRALRAHRSAEGNRVGAPSAADQARQAFEQFGAARQPSASGVNYRMLLCAALANGDPELLPPLARHVARDPLNWRRLAEIAALLPKRLDQNSTAALGELLESVAAALAGSPPADVR